MVVWIGPVAIAAVQAAKKCFSKRVGKEEERESDLMKTKQLFKAELGKDYKSWSFSNP